MRSCWKKTAVPFLAALALASGAAGVLAAVPQYRGRELSQWTEALQNRDIRQRWYATLALAKIGPDARAAVGPLLNLLEDRSQYEYVRSGAAFALGSIQADADRVVPVLAQTLQSELASVRRHSARALGQFGRRAQSAVPQLLSPPGFDDPVFRIDLAEALWRIARHPQATAYLIEQARESRAPGRFEAVEALGRLASEDAESTVPALIEALGADDEDIARSAARSLGRAGSRVIPLLEKAAATSPVPVRRRIAEAYGWMGREGADGLIAAIKDQAPEVRREAVRCLGRLRSDLAAAEPALLRAVSDPDSLVRATAAQALQSKNGR